MRPDRPSRRAIAPPSLGKRGAARDSLPPPETRRIRNPRSRLNARAGNRFHVIDFRRRRIEAIASIEPLRNSKASSFPRHQAHGSGSNPRPQILTRLTRSTSNSASKKRPVRMASHGEGRSLHGRHHQPSYSRPALQHFAEAVSSTRLLAAQEARETHRGVPLLELLRLRGGARDARSAAAIFARPTPCPPPHKGCKKYPASHEYCADTRAF